MSIMFLPFKLYNKFIVMIKQARKKKIILINFLGIIIEPKKLFKTIITLKCEIFCEEYIQLIIFAQKER